VKNSAKFYHDASGVLRTTILSALAPHALALPSPSRGLRLESAPGGSGGGWGGAGAAGAHHHHHHHAAHIPPSQSAVSFCDSASDGGGGGEELRCVIAVVRHGDRTPKQKMKLRLRDAAFLALYAAQRPRGAGARPVEVKLKSAEQLQGVLDACRDMLRRLEEGADCGVAVEDRAEKAEKLRAVVAVLSRKSSDSGGHFSGACTSSVCLRVRCHASSHMHS
jgi:inositol hexakisphosphate/diphosphoinositol-pentakisphosphate kinase